MDRTPVSLLVRLQQPGDQEAWSKFVSLATPMLLGWARSAGVNGEDAADLVQDVFAVLVRKLPEFRYDRDKTFRGWLRAVTLNKWRERFRRTTPASLEAGEELLAEAAVADAAETFWQAEYRGYLVSRALEVMREQFEPATWQACWRQVVDDCPAKQVAEELGISVASVYAAKSRVLRRLRRELDGMLE
jgi:RNA polymerase sigma-70 factor (ECF subfamily)